MSRRRRSGRFLWCASAAVSALLLAGQVAVAHTRSLSYSTWELDPDGATVRGRFSLLDLTRLGLDPTEGGDTLEIGRYLVSRIQMANGAGSCSPTRDPVRLSAPTGWAVYAWRLACPASPSASRTVTSRLLLEVAPSHLHFLRMEGSDGRVVDRVLSEAEPSFRVTAFDAEAAADADLPESHWAGFTSYLSIGVEHILSGWDHLAFLLALLLLAGRLGEVALLVSAFTLAHSVTLGLATLGWVRPDVAAVEALIGFSIALVAAENVWELAGRRRLVPWCCVALLGLFAAVGGGALGSLALLGLALFSLCHFQLLGRARRPSPVRAAVAFSFGLVHGFGFAGVLSELALPVERLIPALLGFNLGVELGQLAIVAGAWPLLRWLSLRLPGQAERTAPPLSSTAPPLPVWGSAAIAGLGCYWFAWRLFGP